MAEGECHDSLGRRPDDEQRYPEPQERWQGPKRCVDVSVVTARPRDGRTKFCIAESAECG